MRLNFSRLSHRIAFHLSRQRHLLLNLQSIPFERHNFLRMVRQHSDPRQPQINQNLRANPTLPLNQSLTVQAGDHPSARMNQNTR